MNGEADNATDKAAVKWSSDQDRERWQKQAQRDGAALALRKRQKFLLFQYFRSKPGQRDKEQWIAM